MGQCVCKESKRRRQNRNNRPAFVDREFAYASTHNREDNNEVENPDVKDLILETLSVIRDLVNNDQEPPSSLLRMNNVAENEDGWHTVVRSLVESIPEKDALGPAVITLFLDESPLPTREAVARLITALGIGKIPHSSQPWSWHRNACIALGSLAEKMAGPSSASLCTRIILNYLVDNLSVTRNPEVILFSLIALEKFAQTTENRQTIQRVLEEKRRNPLEILERWIEEDPMPTQGVVYNDRVREFWRRQVSFCAQWSLDNIFVSDTRTYSCMVTDVTHINAMLNHADVSEYLKIGPDGLQARCDVSSFESVRCTFEVDESKRLSWYYEATILTAGVMQIGWATKKSKFLNHEGYGIGDDEYSIAYDGCRQLTWHNAKGRKHATLPWVPGDVIGCLLDTKKKTMHFFKNGKRLIGTPATIGGSNEHKYAIPKEMQGDGIFAAASFMSFQQCIFNFGATPFVYPPEAIIFTSFNEGGARLTQEEKTILPRKRRVEMLMKEPTLEDACTICCSRQADTVTVPCMHGGLCSECALQVENCPFCRGPVQVRLPASSVKGNEVVTVKIHTSV